MCASFSAPRLRYRRGMRKLVIAAWLASVGSMVAACSEPPHAVPPKAPNNEIIVGEYERRSNRMRTRARPGRA